MPDRGTSEAKKAEHTYDRFIQFEDQAATIYFTMASHSLPQNPELGTLWLDMGMQEKEHAGLLQFCLFEHLFAEWKPSETLIRSLEKTFAGLAERAASSTLSIHEAFQVAAELEVSEVNDIYSYLTTPLHNSTYMLKRKIVTSMPEHVERLLDAARKHSVPEAIISGLAAVATKSSH